MPPGTCPRPLVIFVVGSTTTNHQNWLVLLPGIGVVINHQNWAVELGAANFMSEPGHLGGGFGGPGPLAHLPGGATESRGVGVPGIYEVPE